MIAKRSTLVLIAPTKEGLVVAADSRSTVGERFCDNQQKIIPITALIPTIITVTGTGEFFPPPSAEQWTDICRYVATAPKLMDVAGAVKSHLEDDAVAALDVDLTTVGRVCVGEVERYRACSGTHGLASMRSSDLCRVVLASFDPRRDEAFIGHVGVSLSEDTVPQFSVGPAERLGAQSAGGVWSFGETDYLNANVFGGIGRVFLASETIRFVSERRKAGETAIEDATRALTDILSATSRTTMIVAPLTGIGGPANVMVLGPHGLQSI